MFLQGDKDMTLLCHLSCLFSEINRSNSTTYVFIWVKLLIDLGLYETRLLTVLLYFLSGWLLKPRHTVAALWSATLLRATLSLSLGIIPTQRSFIKTDLLVILSSASGELENETRSGIKIFLFTASSPRNVHFSFQGRWGIMWVWHLATKITFHFQTNFNPPPPTNLRDKREILMDNKLGVSKVNRKDVLKNNQYSSNK